MVKVCFMCKRPFEKASTRSYHLFPNDVSLRHEWFKKLGVEPTGARFLYLCSDHFTSDKFLIRPQGRRVLRKDATPATPVRSPSPATSATTETASEGSPNTTVEDEPTNIETITIESTKVDPNEIEPILKSDSGFILVMTTSLSPAPSPTESAGENCVDFAEEIEITDSPINEVRFPQDPISPSATIQHQEEIIHVEMQRTVKESLMCLRFEVTIDCTRIIKLQSNSSPIQRESVTSNRQTVAEDVLPAKQLTAK
ncbi:hypothetical protein Zmor_017422 [Zophobas morio]|uniref:THAP-type domain-containing protein n=1 Tax=Zophobas morio TaxID=2755281 RepID=A0AA38I549_9CUCU|nr:hypothetical protein Zmor_017422 [Zophobas morio]